MQTIADGIARGFDAAEIEGAFASQLARWRTENPGDQSSTRLRGQIIGMGSNDISLELLAQQYQQLHQDTRIVMADVGSLAGLMAMARGEAHFAASHLFDPKSGDYNIATLRRLFPKQAFTLITLASRAQGFIVPAGNPKHIATMQDLARRGVRLVNRQRGSGTRVLLAELLRAARIPQRSVRGFDREETTHSAVAAAVAQGTADVGVGIKAAAQAFGLDFLPLRWERFELVFPHGAPIVSGLVDAIKRPEFQRAVLALGGYDLKLAGQVRTIKASRWPL
jgi:putative molybdopterin biosynthesis protein